MVYRKIPFKLSILILNIGENKITQMVDFNESSAICLEKKEKISSLEKPILTSSSIPFIKYL